MIASELAEVERELLRIADDIEDRDEWHDHSDSCARLRSVARQIAVQVETAKLRAA